MKSIQHI